MIQMDKGSLDSKSSAYLDKKQKEINSVNSYSDRVTKGKELWKNKSSKRFEPIREKLVELCVGPRRCNYCEDSVADEVEHIKPKDLYPEYVFIWNNYLLACGRCNGLKNNKFAIFGNNGKVVDITRKPKDPVVPPQTGAGVFINPRFEDPSDFIALDLGTLRFIPKIGITPTMLKRAEYTIRVLLLNRRDELVEARRISYETYSDSLKVYVAMKKKRASEAKLNKKAANLENRQHPIVWHEMKRQRDRHPVLKKLFAFAPELLDQAQTL